MRRWWEVWPVFVLYGALLFTGAAVARAAHRAVDQGYARFATVWVMYTVGFAILELGLLVGAYAFAQKRLRLTPGKQTWH